MPKTDPTKPLCIKCGVRNGLTIYKGLCSKCYAEKLGQKDKSPLADIGAQMAGVKTPEDWQKLAKSLSSVVEAIARGGLKATAAQASILKTIYDRAYGRVTKSQEEGKGPLGIVVLPILGTGVGARICPYCLEEHTKHV